MKSFRFRSLLQNSGWLDDAVVTVDERGKIASIEVGTSADEFVDGYAIPGFQNAHSHAFQFAMAGLAENHAGDDDFWSWRDKMYSLALNLDPDAMRSIATTLYSEMLRHGWTSVAEFHYLHHDKNGAPYANPAAMGEALCEAAKDAGIKLTLVPIFYQLSGFGAAPRDDQRRFISKTFDDYARLFGSTRDVCARYENANVAVGVHSLRAVAADDIKRVADELPRDVPFHIHIAEQLREVEDSIGFLGARPVEWLLDNVDIGERFHLVHATHLTTDETARLAASRANVVLCPTTEGNLGDGIFPLRDFKTHGGSWSLGTDSHVGLDPFEEIRLLDYGQRLSTHKRNTFGDDAGRYAVETALSAGRRAMNFESDGVFEVGDPFDAVVIDAATPQLMEVEPSQRLSAIVYSGARAAATFVDGERTGARSDEIRTRFGHLVRSFRR